MGGDAYLLASVGVFAMPAPWHGIVLFRVPRTTPVAQTYVIENLSIQPSNAIGFRWNPAL